MKIIDYRGVITNFILDNECIHYKKDGKLHFELYFDDKYNLFDEPAKDRHKIEVITDLTPFQNLAIQLNMGEFIDIDPLEDLQFNNVIESIYNGIMVTLDD